MAFTSLWREARSRAQDVRAIIPSGLRAPCVSMGILFHLCRIRARAEASAGKIYIFKNFSHTRRSGMIINCVCPWAILVLPKLCGMEIDTGHPRASRNMGNLFVEGARPCKICIFPKLSASVWIRDDQLHVPPSNPGVAKTLRYGNCQSFRKVLVRRFSRGGSRGGLFESWGRTRLCHKKGRTFSTKVHLRCGLPFREVVPREIDNPIEKIG